MHVDTPLNVRALCGEGDYDVHVIDGIGRGSFRVTMHGIVAVTGILGATAVTVMFAYFRKEEALECLERVFGGARAAYETGLASAL